jgi:hypothetical protein
MVRRMVFSRPRYFFGKILSVDDLTAEHNYFLEKQRLRNQLVFGDGIVSGLSVAVGKEGSGRRVVLSPGLAIDPAGNEICVRDVMTCALPPSGTRIYVCLRYVEAETSPVPTILSDSDGVGNEVQNSRIEEGFEMTFEPTLPARTALTLALALLLWKRNRWTVSSSFRPRRVKGGSR